MTKKTILNSFTKLYLHNIFTIHNISNSPFQNYKYKLPEYKSSAFPRTMNDQISFSSNRNSMQKFKVVLVGDQNVGKSSMIARYIRNEFDPTKNVHLRVSSAYNRYWFRFEKYSSDGQNGQTSTLGYSRARKI